MQETSQAFKDLMESNVRPKCEPVIIVSGIDNEGNETTLVWEAKNIKSMNYKWGIDPIGRNFPFMELTWTEIYKGKLGPEAYPEKYKNIVKYMEVELSFKQNLGFFNTWKNVLSKYITWKSIKDNGKTWKEIKNDIIFEKITFPKMFLSARPVIEGQTITWTANDVLSFLEDKQVKPFCNDSPIPFSNPVAYLLLYQRGSFLESNKIFESLTDSVNSLDYFNDLGHDPKPLTKNILFDSSTKDALKNYLCLENKHLSFEDNILVVKDLNQYYESYDENKVYRFTEKLLFEHPKITNGTNISSYVFKSYLLHIDKDNPYSIDPSETVEFYGASFYKYNFNGYGTPFEDRIENISYAYSNPNQPSTHYQLTVFPVNYDSYDNVIKNEGATGEAYIEDNPVNPFGKDSEYAKDRFNFLKNYFSSNSSSIEFSGLPNISIEPGDIVEVETNLSSDGEKIIKNALLISLEITYNGLIKEKYIAHEVLVNDN